VFGMLKCWRNKK